jgi:hypothetical protein
MHSMCECGWHCEVLFGDETMREGCTHLQCRQQCGFQVSDVTRFRYINALLWLYLWLSQALLPVTTGDDFWSAKGAQLLRFGPFDDISRLIGRAVIPFILWYVVDWMIRRRQRRAAV